MGIGVGNTHGAGAAHLESLRAQQAGASQAKAADAHVCRQGLPEHQGGEHQGVVEHPVQLLVRRVCIVGEGHGVVRHRLDVVVGELEFDLVQLVVVALGCAHSGPRWACCSVRRGSPPCRRCLASRSLDSTAQP